MSFYLAAFLTFALSLLLSYGISRYVDNLTALAVHTMLVCVASIMAADFIDAAHNNSIAPEARVIHVIALADGGNEKHQFLKRVDFKDEVVCLVHLDDFEECYHNDKWQEMLVLTLDHHVNDKASKGAARE